MAYRIVHLSDLHFGRIEAGVLEALLAAVHALAPRTILVSGDLTQRAFARQFEAAADFLRKLPIAPICVPGNHDVPLLNPLARLVAPLAAYRRHVDARVDRFHEDEAVAIAALNTAHGLTTMHGRLTSRQAEWLEARFADARAPVRLVVAHHPLDLPPDDPHPVPALAARLLPRWVERLRVDLFLAGHLHRTRIVLGPLRVTAARRAVFTQAGTTTSDRRYSEVSNAFNAIDVAPGEIRIAPWHRMPGGTFAPAAERRFLRGTEGWREPPA